MGIFFAALAGVLTVIGSAFAKQWSITDKPSDFALTLLFYIAGSVAFPFALRHGSLSVLNTFAAVLAAVLTVLVGVFLFHENLKPLEIAGIAASVVAIALLSIR